jgi:hypothetical protein
VYIITTADLTKKQYKKSRHKISPPHRRGVCQLADGVVRHEKTVFLPPATNG